MEPLLEKLSNEFGSREVQMDNQDGLNSAPSEKQPSCLGDMSRDSTFEERLVDRLIHAQNKQFKELQSMVKREIADTNRRIDDLIDDESDDHQSVSESEEPPPKIMKQVDKHSGAESPKRGEASTSSSVISRLTKQYDNTDKTGPPVDEKLANIMRSILKSEEKSKKDEKTRESLIEKHLRPENCELLLVPKVNKEIWRTLPSGTRNKDLEVQKPQKMVVNAMVPLLSVVDSVIREDPNGDNPSTNSLVDNVMDALAMLSHANDDLNALRRSSIRPSLHTDYRALCSAQNPVTENLFGDNITEQFKNNSRGQQGREESQ